MSVLADNEMNNLSSKALVGIMIVTSIFSGAVGGAVVRFIDKSEGKQVLRVDRLEIVDKKGRATMVMDGTDRRLVIADEEASTECISLGRFGFGYALRMRTPGSLVGSLMMSATNSEPGLLFGSDGSNILDPDEELAKENPTLWSISVNAETKEFELMSAIYNDNEIAQRWKPIARP